MMMALSDISVNLYKNMQAPNQKIMPFLRSIMVCMVDHEHWIIRANQMSQAFSLRVDKSMLIYGKIAMESEELE